MNDALLGLDIGTTSTKAVLFNLDGSEGVRAEQPYDLRTPEPGWVEQDPEDLWRALLSVLKSIVDQAGARLRITALSLAAQSGSLVPAQRDGTPVYPAVTWMDGRTESLVRRWRAEGVEERVRSLSGWHLYPGLCLPTIAWLRLNRPRVYARTEHYFSVNDFLVHRLTDRLCTNPSNAGGMQLLDIATGEWSAELCAVAGIEPGQLSPILASGASIGRITPEVSRLTGLPAKTIVVNGGHDQGCTALGLGVTEPGKILLGCGTAWVITGVTTHPAVDLLPPSLDLNFLPAHRRWTVSQSLGGLGASVEWLLRRCWPTVGTEPSAARADAYAHLNAELEETTPGGNGLFFLPLTGGHGAPAGDQHGGLWGLRLDHARADMARAAMEGAAYELRWALEGIREAGMPVEKMWMIGGAASSPLWPAIVADVTGVPLVLPEARHWPAAGAAILAGLGSGAFETAAIGQARFQRPVQEVEPDPERVQAYADYFRAYRQFVGAVPGGD